MDDPEHSFHENEPPDPKKTSNGMGSHVKETVAEGAAMNMENMGWEFSAKKDACMEQVTLRHGDVTSRNTDPKRVAKRKVVLLDRRSAMKPFATGAMKKTGMKSNAGVRGRKQPGTNKPEVCFTDDQFPILADNRNTKMRSTQMAGILENSDRMHAMVEGGTTAGATASQGAGNSELTAPTTPILMAIESDAELPGETALPCDAGMLITQPMGSPNIQEKSGSITSQLFVTSPGGTTHVQGGKADETVARAHTAGLQSMLGPHANKHSQSSNGAPRGPNDRSQDHMQPM